jgi:8-oxo-dGTP diphosphatase
MTEKPYCYRYPHLAVKTDVVIFTLREERLELLLVKRPRVPFKGEWSLPGGFLDPATDLDASAMTELEEETGVTGVYLEQLYTFGRPDRDPRERVITVAYYALIPTGKVQIGKAATIQEVGWFAFDKLPRLAFDHQEIVNMARQRLMAKLDYSTIAFQFLPMQFTLSELQNVYEIIRGEEMDKRNFRKWIAASGLIEDTGSVKKNGSHRPARLYRTRFNGQVAIIR